MPSADTRPRVALRAALLFAFIAAIAPWPVAAQVEPSSRPPKPGLTPTFAPSDSMDDEDETPRPTAAALRGGSRPYYVQAPRGWKAIHLGESNPDLVTRFGLPDETGRVPFVPGEVGSITACSVEATARPARDSTTLGQFAAAFTERVRAASPEMFVTPGDTLRTGDGRWTISRKLQGFRSGNVTSVAFLEDERHFVVLRLNGSSETAWKSAFSAWREMVATYSTLGSKKRAGR